MNRVRTALALLVIAFCLYFLLVTDAHAAWSDTYERVAIQYFHDAPDCYSGPGSITYTWTEKIYSNPEENANVAGASGTNDCHILLRPSYWFSRAKVDRCKVFLHEWGHQIGRQHTTNPWSIMYGKPSLFMPRTCERRGWWRAP